MRRSELVRRLQAIPGFPHPNPSEEQVVTPAEAAAELLLLAHGTEGLADCSVLDLGTGTGRLAIGAALLGAKPVTGIDRDPEALEVARTAAAGSGASVEFVKAEAGDWNVPVDIVVMNPPFGAQRRHADRPFWDTAFAVARRAVYAFGLADSRTFIPRHAVARGAQVIETHPVPWKLERTFPHHTRGRVEIAVDLWAFEIRRQA